MKKRTFFVLMFVVVALLGSQIYARAVYFESFRNKYPNVKGSKIDICICHTNPLGGGERNVYRIDFELHNLDLSVIGVNGFR
ncbi:MAG: hypothetical protein R2883_06960 [Caldisericia bacterium]